MSTTAVPMRADRTAPSSRGGSPVKAYLHERAGFAWLDVPGSGWVPDQRVVLRRSRWSPRSLPTGVRHVVVAIRAPGSVPVELVTGVLMARRLLDVRDVSMTLGIWGDAPVSEALAEILARVPAVRPDDDVTGVSRFLTQVGLDARSEQLGWTRWQ